MKKRLIPIACALALSLLPGKAQMYSSVSTTDVAADALVVRPVSFIGTVLGSAVFVVTLPFTVPCGGVHTAAEALVVKPAEYTFKRELGDLESTVDD